MSHRRDGRGGPQVLVVMGVSGVGKTTIAKGLAARMGWVFAEGDDLHPECNIAKMQAGLALTDEDRWPWLRRLRDWVAHEIAAGRSSVVTCSALKRSYRDLLREAGPQVRFLHLAAPESVVGDRVRHRAGHFMPTSLLHSQYDTLEPLGADELAMGSVVVPVDGTSGQVLTHVLDALGLAVPVPGAS